MAYALITGATKGIGKAIAEELARRKINVLLVARSEDLLKHLSKNISALYNVEAHYFAADLSDICAASKIFEWCQSENYDVFILVNNAGFGLCGALDQYPLQDHLDMIQVNINAPLQLIYLFLPQLKLRSQAYIMNIASSSSYLSVPGMNVYASSKAFILSFSRGLRHELRNTSISVTVVSPGSTDTEFIRASINSPKALKLAAMFNMSAQQVASAAVNGMFAEKTEVIPGFINKLNAFFVWRAPKSFSERSAGSIYGI